MKRSELIRFLILRTIGNFLVLFAIFGIIATFGPAIYYEISFRIVEFRGVKYVVAAQPKSQITNQKSQIGYSPDLLIPSRFIR